MVEEENKDLLNDLSVSDNEEVNVSVDNTVIEVDDNDEVENAFEDSNKAQAASFDLDEIDDTPQSDIYVKIKADTKIPKDLVLTIEDVRIMPIYTKDLEGNPVLPSSSANGEYYKTKLEVKFKEEINERKIREFYNALFASVENGVIQTPRPPKACTEDDLDDNFTSELAKLRFKYARFNKIEVLDLGAGTFLKGLVGMKVKVSIKRGKYNGEQWQKLSIDDFAK